MVKNKFMKIIQLVSLAVLALLALSSASWAMTYYVDATNGNDSNDGLSKFNTWNTIAKVNSSSFQPGDQIFFKRGQTWTGETINISSDGEIENHITIGAYGNGDKPIIDGTGLSETIYLNGRSFITINNLELKKGGHVIFITPSSTNGQINITNSDIHNSENNNNISIKDRGNVTIESCTIYNSAANGISAYTLDASDWGSRAGHNVKVLRNTIYNNSKNGLFIHGDNVVVRNNEMHGNGSGDWEGYYHNIYISGDNALIENNILREAVYGDGIRFLGSNLTAHYNFIHHNRRHGMGIWNDYPISHSNLNISYNLFIQHSYLETPVSQPMTINIDNATGAGNFSNIKIYNNSIYGENDNANGFRFDNCSNVDFRNNILNLKAAYLMKVTSNASITSDNNMFKSDKDTPFYSEMRSWFATFSQWQGDGYDAHSTENDPGFTDPINSNLTLQSTSFAIDEGENLSQAYDNGLHGLHPNSTWPNGLLTLNQDNFGGWEIGAYVYQPCKLMEAPKNLRVLF